MIPVHTFTFDSIQYPLQTKIRIKASATDMALMLSDAHNFIKNLGTSQELHGKITLPGERYLLVLCLPGIPASNALARIVRDMWGCAHIVEVIDEAFRTAHAEECRRDILEDQDGMYDDWISRRWRQCNPNAEKCTEEDFKQARVDYAYAEFQRLTGMSLEAFAQERHHTVSKVMFGF